MIISEKRVERYLASAGLVRVISEAQWREIFQRLQETVSHELCFSYCLVTQQEPPGKFPKAGFPAELLENVRYLHEVHLYLPDEDTRGGLERMLSGWGVDYSFLRQFEPESGEEVVVGIRLQGFRKGS